MANLQIPLPSLEVQKKIVEEIENKLSAINHADEIIKNLEKERKYFTNLLEEIEHKDMELGEICEELFAGGDVPKDNWSKEKTEQYTIPIYSNGIGERSLYGWTDIARVNKDAITISARGTIGYPEIRKAPFYPVIRLIVAVPKDNIKLGYLKLALENANISGNGNSIPQLTIPMIKQIKIPLPSLYEQEKIVSKIKEEESIIAANTKLIDIMQSKINQVINRIYKE
jgi:restriction endonuclease S subunit